MFNFKKDSILFLLGAGASVDAGIPHAKEMIEKIEDLIENNSEEWGRYRDLYNYIKSSIYFAEGIKGRFSDGKVQFNIERLVNTLDELAKKEEHPIYPFVGSWNPRLTEVVHTDFKNIEEFKKLIVKELIDKWVQLENYDKADYFKGLSSFQKEYGQPLRVFSLNYDLCVEKNTDVNIQAGFDESRIWDWRLFDECLEGIDIFLYKLHGSINWKRDAETDNLKLIDRNSSEAEIIFGTSYKLQYVDPFLFLAYEFRRWTLENELKLIISVGYGFGDEHINGILGQSLNNAPDRKLYVVLKDDDVEEQKKRISKLIDLRNQDQIEYIANTAKDFFTGRLKIDEIKQLFPQQEETPF